MKITKGVSLNTKTVQKVEELMELNLIASFSRFTEDAINNELKKIKGSE